MPHAQRVLVVDDEPSNRILVERALAAAGYLMTSAGDADEAMAAIRRSGPFDGYILDVMMPRVRGTELAVLIRRTQPDARILFFSGYTGELSARATAFQPNDTILAKPVSVGDLRQAVSRLLAP